MRDFKKWMGKRSDVKVLGQVAVFYLPADKLHAVREELHSFFVSKHGAYTHESSDIKGYWMDKDRLFKDVHERYEISLSGDENLKNLVLFLSEVCKKIGEECIYLTVGGDSYLVS